ncbi:hypothetical protein INR49_016727 [Caranx melampygus]|nr:hypothetical protein INR49_016727 [Caranx melampygus]
MKLLGDGRPDLPLANIQISIIYPGLLVFQEHRRVDDENGGVDCSGIWHCYAFGFTLPYLANQPITVYAERIKVGQVPTSALSLPASSARPLPGRCLCRSPHSTDYCTGTLKGTYGQSHNDSQTDGHQSQSQRRRCILPVQSDGSHGVDAGKHSRDRKEVVETAVDQSEVPLIVHGVGEVDDRVEGGHGGFGERQVQQKIVGDCPHALVRYNNPDHCDITHDGHDNYTAVSDGPEDDPPDRLHELVPVYCPVIGVVVAGGPVWHISGVE